MITVVGVVGRQMETSQQSLRISKVDMVNPPTGSVSGSSHKLLEAKVIESSREETVGMLV